MSAGFISTFEIFKLSIGPSSSHTMGPMLAASDFIELIQDERVTDGQLKEHLYGCLALTGRGHQADKAIVLGL
jgi:L-serine dehydratase